MKNETKVFEGSLTAKPGVVYDYTEITGGLNANQVTCFIEAFPRLKAIGGDLDLYSLTSAEGLKLPEAIGSFLDLHSLTSAEGLKLPEAIGGSLDLHSLTSAEGLKLPEAIGGFLDLQSLTSAKPDIGTCDEEARERAKEICRTRIMSAFAAAGFSFADGILARIVSKRGPVARVVICGKTEVSYVVTDGTSHSHGKTLKEARDGLIYKIGSRDTTEFKAWSLNRTVSKRDAIRAYRAITGACEGGVRAWMEQRQTPEKITVGGIIELTKGAYGAEAFRKFFIKGK